MNYCTNRTIFKRFISWWRNEGIYIYIQMNAENDRYNILRFVLSDKIHILSENFDLLRLISPKLLNENHGTWDIMWQATILVRAQLHVKVIYSINHQTQKYTYIVRNHCFPSSICNIHFRYCNGPIKNDIFKHSNTFESS